MKRATIIETRTEGEDWQSCTWGDFLAANAEMPAGDLAEIVEAISGSEVYRGGGGAAPSFELRRASSIRIDDSAYRSSHGAAPRGRGSWAFVMGKSDYSFVDEKDAQGRAVVWFAPGALLFGQAKKLALAEARSRGVSLIGVAP